MLQIYNQLEVNYRFNLITVFIVSTRTNPMFGAKKIYIIYSTYVFVL